ncbi:MAG: hypothetical protein A3H32_07395 [Betaproteobacteria bacterium RIFCSPLOWO2_02_FULL_63_19]|nr:MAG: hypothetical protein A3H32_07395 [Betaproteobacteria bacterium RIFCSPLOWO2_02_FULL_63_19]
MTMRSVPPCNRAALELADQRWAACKRLRRLSNMQTPLATETLRLATIDTVAPRTAAPSFDGNHGASAIPI